MKNLNLILALVTLCLLTAVAAFVAPVQGMALSYLTITLAVAVGIVCIVTMYQLFRRKG